MIKTTVSNISYVKDSSRFEPRYHYEFNKWEEMRSSKAWQVLLFGDPKIMKRMTDGEHAGQVFVNNGVRFIKNSYVKDYLISTLDGTFISEEKHFLQSRSSLKPLDILFTTIGHLGSCAIVPEGFGEANINQNLVKIEIDQATVDPYYLVAYLNSSFTRSQISALFTGNLHSIITYPKIRSIRILIPSKQVQSTVASRYKQALALENQAIDLINKALEAFRNALGIDLISSDGFKTFSVSLDSFHRDGLWTPQYSNPLYQNTLDQLVKKHKSTRLSSSFFDIRKGDEVGSEQYIKYLEKKDSDVPFVRTSDMFNFGLDNCPDFFVDRSLLDELGQDLKSGDVLFSNDGKIGLTGLVHNWTEFILQSHISRIRLKPLAYSELQITPEYLFLCLSLPEIGGYQSRKFSVVQSTIPTISSNLENFYIPILPNQQIVELSGLIAKAFELKESARVELSKMRTDLESRLSISDT